MIDLPVLFSGHPFFLYVVTAAFGLTVGSFLNVVIHRLPIILEQDWKAQCRSLLDDPALPSEPAGTQLERYNLVTPGSHCPGCGHKIRAIENIPVISFLLQKGKCKHCGQKISRRYPAVELISVVLALVVIWKFGFGIQAGAALLLTWALISLSFIDYDHQLLPDNITLPFLWFGLLLNSFSVFTSLQDAVIGAIAGYLFLWIIFQLFKLLTGRDGMGYGDFKLLALFGAWFGWQMLPLTILLASLVGAVVGIGNILFRGAGRNQPIPFGPFLCAAGWIAMLWGNEITRSYFRLAHIPY